MYSNHFPSPLSNVWPIAFLTVKNKWDAQSVYMAGQWGKYLHISFMTVTEYFRGTFPSLDCAQVWSWLSKIIRIII